VARLYGRARWPGRQWVKPSKMLKVDGRSFGLLARPSVGSAEMSHCARRRPIADKQSSCLATWPHERPQTCRFAPTNLDAPSKADLWGPKLDPKVQVRLLLLLQVINVLSFMWQHSLGDFHLSRVSLQLTN